MTVYPEEWIIVGTTADGKTFRPSDWAERLCGAVASFGHDNRLAYSDYVRPIWLSGVAAVRISTILEELNPQAYWFLLDFARENRLALRLGRGKFRLEMAEA